MNNKQHICCPNCGSKIITTTLIAYIGKDLNGATCLHLDPEGNPIEGCGWSGYVDDLVPEEKL